METHEKSIPDMRKLLEHLCERDGSVELASIEDSDDPEMERGFHRARVLEIKDDHLLLERPTSRGIPIKVQAGQPIFCVALNGGQRFSFETKAIGGQVFQLNEKTKLPAIRAAWPKRVMEGQRRDYFRVSMPLNYRVPVALTPIAAEDLESAVEAEWSNQCLLINDCPVSLYQGVRLPRLGLQTVDAELKDISASGMGLLVPIIMARHLKDHNFFWVRLNMPMMGPTVLTARRVFFTKRSSTMVQAGFRFIFSHHERREKPLTRMIHDMSYEIQRELLRKRSGND